MRDENHMPPLVLFDGVCNLCNGTVNFIIARDPNARFRFSSLQSAAARDVLENHRLESNLDTIVLVEHGQVYTRSTAALRIVKQLSGLWPLLGLFLVVPSVLRDAVYVFVAKNRYRWFGKSESCSVPTPELAARFLS